MGKTQRFLAFDLGAESGRAVLGEFSGGRIDLKVVHRFPTEGLVVLGRRQWDVTRIYQDMVEALRVCARDHGPHLDGIAVDTWGVDFGLLASDDTLLGNPTHYRDRRTEGMFEQAFQRAPRREIYEATGIQFMEINTLYQLLAMRRADSPLLDAAGSFLMMNDLFTFMLSGVKACEYTNASTTQLLDPRTGDWHDGLIDKLGLPRGLFPTPTPPGTVLGTLLPEIAAETGVEPGTPIITAGGHDTADAIAAVPAEADGDWAYLSSGTWSLMGAEIDAPVINDAAYEADITNEGGIGGKITFLKNIAGLWLVQQCRRAWTSEGEDPSYADLTAAAAEVAPFQALVAENDPSLVAPDDMPAAIRALCAARGYPEPESRGAVIRCALESLALAYRRTLRNIDGILGRTTSRLHIIGGGTQNRLLNQMAADACGVPVLTGPVEATSLGNILVQAMAVGAVDSLDAARQVVSRSVEIERFEPRDTAAWEKAEADFRERA